MAPPATPHVHQPGDPDAAPRVAWTATSDDLHVNLVALAPGEEIAPHVNAQLEVLLTCVEGRGTLTVADEEIPLRPGTVVLIPRGARRGTRAGDEPLRYVTCHRKRAGMMPAVAPRTRSEP